MQVVLASGSPQRRDILGRLGIEFEVIVPEIAELREGEPEAVVVENARSKARAVGRPHELVLGCDTDVVVDGALLGKPADEAVARDYLERLSGREHQVLSGLVLIGPENSQERSGVSRSSVRFHELDRAAVERYLAFGEWRGRAGAYAIQGLGSTLVAAVEGDIANVIGLPVALLLELAPEIAP